MMRQVDKQHRDKQAACLLPSGAAIMRTNNNNVTVTIGLLSHVPKPAFRDAIRRSWLSPAAKEVARNAGVLVNFVLRAGDYMNDTRALAEEARHGDVALVPASPFLGRKRGPLAALLLWWRCALEHWPRASLIGKGDDDVYLNLQGIAAHARASEASVRAATGAEPRLLWGAMEQYSWHAPSHRPIHHKQDGPGRRCEMQSEVHAARETQGGVWGPFPFARGPLYMVSRSLVAELLASAWLRELWNATLASAADLSHERTLPYEDVFTGLALSAAIKEHPGLALVETGYGNGWASPVYSDGWGLALKSSTLIMHMRTKVASRIAFSHRWLETEGRECRPPGAHNDAERAAWVRCGWPTRRAGTVSCTGALWRRCSTNRSAYLHCDTTLVDLTKTARAYAATARA